MNLRQLWVVGFVFACSSSNGAMPPSAATAGNSGTAGSAGAVGNGGAAGTAAAGAPAVSVSGELGGKAFDARGGAAHRFYWQGDTIVQGGADPAALLAGVSFVITQYANACTATRDTTLPILAFYLRSSQPELAPQTFPLVDSTVAGGTDAPPEATVNVFGLYPDVCSVSNLDWATSGNVELSNVSATRIDGTFSLTLGTGGVLTGTFSVDDCFADKPVPDDSDLTLACGII